MGSEQASQSGARKTWGQSRPANKGPGCTATCCGSECRGCTVKRNAVGSVLDDDEEEEGHLRTEESLEAERTIVSAC